MILNHIEKLRCKSELKYSVDSETMENPKNAEDTPKGASQISKKV